MPFKPLKVDQWFTELDRALEYRRKYGLEDKWHELEGLMYSVHPSQNHSAPNIIMETGDAILSAMSVPYPYITVTPRRRDFVQQAPTVERVDNTLLWELDIPDEFEMAILNAFLMGVGIMKIGFDSEFGYNPKFDVQPDAGMTLTMLDRKGRAIEYGGTRPGMPWMRLVDNRDFLVPWGTGPNLDRAQWACQRFVRHIDDIKADDKYENTSKLKPVMTAKDWMESYNSVLKPYRTGDVLMSGRERFTRDGETEFVEGWEIHDQKTGRVMVIATGHDKFLRNEVDLMQVGGGLPFVNLAFTPRAKTFWTTSDAYYLLTHQAELTDIALQSQKIRRAMVVKFLYQQDAIDPLQIDKMSTADVLAGIMVNGGFDVDKAVKILQTGTAPELHYEKDAVRRDSRSVVGFSRNQQGEFESRGRRTASEALIVDRHAGQRANRRQVRVARAYNRAFEKINALAFANWRTPRQIQVIGQDGLEDWATFTGQGIAGEYSLEVGFSDEPPVSLGARRQEALQTYMIMREDPAVDQVGLRRYIARAFNDPGFSSIFKEEALKGAILPDVMSQLQGGLGRAPANGGVQPGAGGGGAQVPSMQLPGGA